MKWLLVAAMAFPILSCKKTTSRTLTVEECRGLSEQEQFECMLNDGVEADNRKIEVFFNAQLAQSISLYGLTYQIRDHKKNQCLTHIENQFFYQTCGQQNEDQQFMFIGKTAIKVNLKKDHKRQSTALKIITRKSFLNLIETPSAEVDQKGYILRCLALGKDSTLTTSDCEKAPFFMHLPNEISKEHVHFNDRIFSSFIMFDDQISKKIELSGLSSMSDYEKDTKWLQQNITRVNDLGDSLKKPGCTSRILVKDKDSGKPVRVECAEDGASKAQGNKRSRIDLVACESNGYGAKCQDDQSIKDIHEDLLNQEKGLVVQVKRKSSEKTCALLKDGLVVDGNCKSSSGDVKESYFRLFADEKTSGDQMNYLLVANEKPGHCLNITPDGGTLVKCPKAMRYRLDQTNNDIYSVDTNQKAVLYDFNFCKVASNHEQDNVYDCHYNVSKKNKILGILAMALGFLPLLLVPPVAIGAMPAAWTTLSVMAATLTIPSIAIDGKLCASNDPGAVMGGCMGLAIGLGVTVLDVGITSGVRYARHMAKGKTFAVRLATESERLKEIQGAASALKKNWHKGDPSLLHNDVWLIYRNILRSYAWDPVFLYQHANMTVGNVFAKMPKLTRKKFINIMKGLKDKDCGIARCDNALAPYPLTDKALNRYLDDTAKLLEEKASHWPNHQSIVKRIKGEEP